MSENVIFCFSGTGNCLDLARNIANVLGDTDIVMMRGVPGVTDARGAKRVGFVFPCHGGGLPGGVEDSLKLIQTDAGAYKFGVCCCSVYPGTGLAVVNRLFPLDYWAVVRHQCSCVWLFPHKTMLPPMSAQNAQARSEQEARRIGQAVKAMERSKKSPKANPLNQLENRAWPAISGMKVKQFAVSGDCISCGTCEKLCPKGNIRLVDGKPQFGADCIQCLACLQYCPKQAISLGRITQKREHYHNPNVTANDLTQPVIHIG